jgi:hypothetical protein
MLDLQQLNTFPLPSSTPAVVPFPNLLNSTQVSDPSGAGMDKEKLGGGESLTLVCAVCQEQLPTLQEAIQARPLGNGE